MQFLKLIVLSIFTLGLYPLWLHIKLQQAQVRLLEQLASGQQDLATTAVGMGETQVNFADAAGRRHDAIMAELGSLKSAINSVEGAVNLIDTGR